MGSVVGSGGDLGEDGEEGGEIGAALVPGWHCGGVGGVVFDFVGRHGGG